MICREPMCLTCEFFRSHPKRPDDSGHCEEVGVISERIYWNGGKCDLYQLSHDAESLEGIMELFSKGSGYWKKLLELGEKAGLLNRKEISLLGIFAKEGELSRFPDPFQARSIRLIEKRLNESGVYAEETNEA